MRGYRPPQELHRSGSDHQTEIPSRPVLPLYVRILQSQTHIDQDPPMGRVRILDPDETAGPGRLPLAGYPDELQKVTLKEIHWLCDGLSLNPSGAFEEHHPKIVI